MKAFRSIFLTAHAILAIVSIAQEFDCQRGEENGRDGSSFDAWWDCDRSYGSGLCRNPRLDTETYYYNLGQPLWLRLCKAANTASQINPSSPETVCAGFKRPRVTLAAGLTRSVALVWLPDYKMTRNSALNGVRSSGFKAQFDLCVTLASYGMETYVTIDFPDDFMDTLPGVRTLASINHTLESFAEAREGRVVVAMPEVNAGRLHRVGIFKDDSAHVRWIMWVMGLERSVEKIKAEHMRIAANVHHSLKQFYGLGASPITANIPQAVVKGSEDFKRSLSRKRNLILVDRDAYFIDIDRIASTVRTVVHDAEFKILRGMDLGEVRAAYQEAKITIDAYMLGGEAINFEGAMWNCLPMVTDQMVGHDDYDLQLPSELKLDPYNATDAASKIVHALQSYASILPKVSAHRHFARNLGSYFDRDASLFFGFASALFVTAATSFEATRAVVPWALSVWSLFPTARIEIYVPNVNLFEKELEGLLLLLRQHGVWQGSFVQLQQIPGEMVERFGDDARFLLVPQSRGHRYTVFSVPGCVLLGRDLLNAHVDAMDTFNLTSTLLTSAVPSMTSANSATPLVAVTRSDAYWPHVLRERPTGEDDVELERAIARLDVVSSVGDVGADARATLRSLPLDVITYEPHREKWRGSQGRIEDSIHVHMTRGWSEPVARLDTYEAAELASALDPLVRNPLWLSLVSFFPVPLQALTFNFPVERYGRSSSVSE